jgi:hypothetical protein
MIACRSSLFFPLTRSCSPWTWLWTLTPVPLMNFTISRALSSLMPLLMWRDWRKVPFAAGWTGPSRRAFSETLRRTSFSFSTSVAALSRFSVLERTSIRSSSMDRLVPVFLKSNLVRISRLAWS